MSPGRRRPAGPDQGPIFDLEPDPVAVAPAPVEHVRITTPTTLAARSVSYARAGRTILDAVSVRAEAGAVLAVVGPSGSGKSSLLALLAGLERPDTGEVHRDPDARTGLVLQGYGLVAVLTAAENVEAPLQAGALGKLAPDEIRRRAAAALHAVGLTAVADHLIEELSGGQQQRVAIARALAIDPSVVLADELSAELDHEWRERVVDLVLDVARRGGVVVLATHDPEIAARADHVVRLVDGRVAAA